MSCSLTSRNVPRHTSRCMQTKRIIRGETYGRSGSNTQTCTNRFRGNLRQDEIRNDLRSGNITRRYSNDLPPRTYQISREAASLTTGGVTPRNIGTSVCVLMRSVSMSGPSGPDSRTAGEGSECHLLAMWRAMVLYWNIKQVSVLIKTMR
jgi:hypothetical protein